MTVGDGRRCSAAVAYLSPALRRANLSVRTHALVTGVLLEGRRAHGVRYLQGADGHVAYARREVILCCGPINSPQP
jgi:choline dehydrogenase